MIVAVEVGVALSRPPRTDRLSRVLVTVDIDPHCPDWLTAESQARVTAIWMATGRPGVVMATSATVTDILEL